jgi:hypothetical protein
MRRQKPEGPLMFTGRSPGCERNQSGPPGPSLIRANQPRRLICRCKSGRYQGRPQHYSLMPD